MSKQKIHFIVTGGTFDGALKEFGLSPTTSTVAEYLDQTARVAFAYELSIPFLKDSRDITDFDRREILNLIRLSVCDAFVIVHGTYTLVETAQLLERQISSESKKIVVTGAMVPINEPKTDAPFNLGFACAAVANVSPGTWVAMHGQLWKPAMVYKNLETNKFESRQ